MGVAIIVVLLVVGTVLFHIFSPWWFTPISSNWGMIDTTVDITVWVTGFVFVAVNLFMALAIWRYRHKSGSRALYEPENRKLETWLTVVTTIGIVGMLAPGLVVWAKYINVPEDAMEVEVVGQQWQWGYRFPGKDGEFGETALRFTSSTNPFGIDPSDANGRDDILVDSNTLHLPQDRPVKIWLRSKDVLHNFAVPQFRAKMDLVPGMVTHFWITPTRAGRFDVLCQELCGIGHFVMRGSTVVEPEADFNDWLAGQATFAEQHKRSVDVDAGKQSYTVCASCHGQNGQGNRQMNAPKLAGLNSDYIERQLRYYKKGIRGAAEGDTYGQQMAAMVNTLADDQAIRNVTAYIATLPDQPVAHTIEGDVADGKSIYRNCSACHGRQGQGIWSTKAPALAGMNDWYLATQLQNFRSGVRGSHPDDEYGQQMRAMTAYLDGEDGVRDVIAYINTLDAPDR
jgi:cytochrome c oxidase subunit 2